MKWKRFEVFAISVEPGAATALRGLRKVLPPNDFRKPVHRFTGIHSAVLICEPLFVY